MNKIDYWYALSLNVGSKSLKLAERIFKRAEDAKPPKPIIDSNIENTLTLLYAAYGINPAQLENATPPKDVMKSLDATHRWRIKNPDLYTAVQSLIEIQDRLMEYYKQAYYALNPMPPEERIEYDPNYSLFETAEEHIARMFADAKKDTPYKHHLEYKIGAFPGML